MSLYLFYDKMLVFRSSIQTFEETTDETSRTIDSPLEYYKKSRRHRNSTRKTAHLRRGYQNLARAGRVDSVDLRVERLEDRRMLSAGDLDLTFGGDGLVFDDFGLVKDEEVFTAAVQEDGKIVVGGLINNPSATGRDFMVARYNPDGTRDATFGTSGVFTFNVSGAGFDDQVNDLVIDPLGRIIAAGSACRLSQGRPELTS